jgi:hypothetical protein
MGSHARIQPAAHFACQEGIARQTQQFGHIDPVRDDGKRLYAADSHG